MHFCFLKQPVNPPGDAENQKRRKMKFDKQKFLPHIVAVVVFMLLSGVYFAPAFQGYKLKQGDIQSWRGMSKDVNDYREIHDDEPLWTNGMFSGMPAYQITMQTKGNLLGYFKDIREVFPRPAFYFLIMMVAFYIFSLSLKIPPKLAGLGAIAFAFSSFFVISIEAGHNTKVFAISYIPAIIAGVIYILRKKYLTGGVIAAAAIGLQLAANHYQITYYTGLLIGLILLFEFVRAGMNKDFKHIGLSLAVLIGSGLLALSSNATTFWTTYEYIESSMRGNNELNIEAEGSEKTDKTGGLDRDYITNWSLGIGETWSLVFPNAKGGETGALASEERVMRDVPSQSRQYVGGMNKYWGNQPFTAGPVYVGAIIVLLFLLGAFTVQHWLRWPLIVGTLLSIMLAWGKNMMWFTDLFIDYFPFYNRFRSVTMILAVAEFLMPAMAVLFLHEFFSVPSFWEKNKKKIFLVSGIFTGVLLIFLIAPSTFFDFYADGELARLESQKQSNPQAAAQIDAIIADLGGAREALFTGDLFRSLFFILAGLGLLFAVAFNKLKSDIAAYILVGLVTVDLWTVNKRYLNNEKQGSSYVQWEKADENEFPFTAQPYDMQILQSELSARPDVQEAIQQNMSRLSQERGRLDNRLKQSAQFATLDSMSNYRVLDLVNNTYNSSRSSYFHKTIGGYNAAKLMRYQQLIDFHMGRRKFNQDVLDMLNTRYIIRDGQSGASVTRNPGAMGNCWLVSMVRTVDNADEEIMALDDFNPREEVIMDKRFAGVAGSDQYEKNGSIEQIGYRLNRMTYKVNLPQTGFGVFSEVYYQPGWNAYIDGEPVEHARVNWILRGMELPAGSYEVEFRFEPNSYSIGEGISFAGSLLILLLAGFAGFKTYQSSKNEEEHK